MAETEKKNKKIKLPKKIFAQNGEHKHGPISRNGHRSYGVVFLPSIAHDFIACKQERLQRLQHINQMVYLGSMEILCAHGLLENQGLDSLFCYCCFVHGVPRFPWSLAFTWALRGLFSWKYRNQIGGVADLALESFARHAAMVNTSDVFTCTSYA